MATVDVKLSKQYTAHGKTFSSVRLREPTYSDVFADGMGPPYELQPNGAGGVMVVTHYELINRYIERLAVDPTAEALTELGAIDAMALSKAVTDFFTAATESKTMPTGSSLEAASPQT